MSATLSDVASATASAVSGNSAADKPASYKVIGVLLAVGSGLFIGVSFVVKKKGLLRATAASGNAAGEGLAYLKNWLWWTGMSLMIIGEILNFVAYAFTEAILVTPLGALSVVVCAILSSIFLNEKLTFFGKIGCLLSILGATIVALNGPQEQSTSTIAEFKDQFLSVGFLIYGSLVIAGSLGLIFFVAPRYGKTHMMVYITICSLIGGLSVACTSGLGSAILTSIRGDNQVKNWFFWFLAGFVVVTLLTEIIFLNKALELFNTAMVTPTYYVIFTGATIITSVVLHKGFDAGPIAIVNVVLGFIIICAGVILLQLSKIDPEEVAESSFVGGALDRRSSMLLSASRSRIRRGDDREKSHSLESEDPGMDAMRGTFGVIGSIHRAMSARRSQRREASFDPQDVARRRHGAPGAAGSGPSEMGLDSLRGVQLYDRPMPLDAVDKISLHSARFASGDDSLRPRSASIQFAPADNVHMYPTNMRGVATHREQDRIPGTHQHLSPLASPVPGSADIGSLDTGRFPRFESPTAPSYIDPFEDRPVQDAKSTSHTGNRFNLRSFSRDRQRSNSRERPRGHLPHPIGSVDMEREESRGLVSGAGQRRDSMDSGRGQDDLEDTDDDPHRLQRFDSRDVL